MRAPKFRTHWWYFDWPREITRWRCWVHSTWRDGGRTGWRFFGVVSDFEPKQRHQGRIR